MSDQTEPLKPGEMVMKNFEVNKEQKKLDEKLIQEIENSAPIYSIVPECVMRSPELSVHSSAFRTFTILNSYSGSTGVTWVSNATIQEKYPSLTEDVIRKNLKILIELGFVFRALDRSSKRGTKRFLVFVGNWRDYFEKCKKVGNLKEAAKVQSFFERTPFETCFEGIKKIFNTRPPRTVGNPAAIAGSREQERENTKETTKKRQNFFLKTPLKKAAADFQIFSLNQKLDQNLGTEKAKRALVFWNSFDEAKQKRIRNPLAFLTSAIRGNWDKEQIKPPGAKGSLIKTASEMNREFALIVSDLIKPNEGLNAHVGKDYFEIYNGSWNKVFRLGEPNTLFKSQTTQVLGKMGIKIPEIKQSTQKRIEKCV